MENNIKVKEQGVHIRLKANWLGTPSGSKMHVWEHVAKELYFRGTCEVLDERVKAKFDGKELEEVKEVKEPPKNKMIKNPNKSK
jgi:hypothetical protein